MNSSKSNSTTTTISKEDYVQATFERRQKAHRDYQKNDLLQYVLTRGRYARMAKEVEAPILGKSLCSQRIAESPVREVISATRRFTALGGVVILEDQRIMAWSKCGEINIS